MSKAPQEKLDALHGDLAEQLAKKIKSGEATAADMAVARQFLKDNGIQSLPGKSPKMKELEDSLPFSNPDDIARGREEMH